MSHLQTSDTQLFVHLSWGTHNHCPILNNDQLRQVAYHAIMARTRSQLCQVLAIGGTSSQIHMIVRFPASLPIISLLRVAREAAKEAITRQQETLDGNWQEPTCFWDHEYTAHTLNDAEAAQAKTSLSRRIAEASLPPQPPCAAPNSRPYRA